MLKTTPIQLPRTLARRAGARGCALIRVSAVKEVLACAIELVSLSAIRRCPLFGVSAIREFLKYGMYGKSSWYIAYCPLYGRCLLFGVSAKRGSTVQPSRWHESDTNSFSATSELK